MSSAVPWGRGTGEGIGLSGHKNEYKSGVRIGNWVEEQFSAEASANAHEMEAFVRTQEEAWVAKAKAQHAEKNQRVEPNMGVASQMLFSHGMKHGEKFGASMSQLHFSDPAARGARRGSRRARWPRVRIGACALPPRLLFAATTRCLAGGRFVPVPCTARAVRSRVAHVVAHAFRLCACARAMSSPAGCCADYGAESNDRVHKSFFYGSKHIDQYVPKVEPNPRMELTSAKQAEWATVQDMYKTTALASSMAYAGVKYQMGR